MYGRRQDLRHKLVPLANERCEEPTVCGGIGTQDVAVTSTLRSNMAGGASSNG